MSDMIADQIYMAAFAKEDPFKLCAPRSRLEPFFNTYSKMQGIAVLDLSVPKLQG
ncbi:MAG: hypothetical protein K5657_08495 [Desulfovibrio sp.]|nr:hypothetical protein [Desulfovibrio sp.]